MCETVSLLALCGFLRGLVVTQWLTANTQQRIECLRSGCQSETVGTRADESPEAWEMSQTRPGRARPTAAEIGLWVSFSAISIHSPCKM
ncbi:hypothetical protein V8C40DRAFT_233954 [Trichoderma camerunense]